MPEPKEKAYALGFNSATLTRDHVAASLATNSLAFDTSRPGRIRLGRWGGLPAAASLRGAAVEVAASGGRKSSVQGRRVLR